MREIRVTFRKFGRARFISHLDMNKFMTRAIRRADISVWYTEGYNQHAYITFAQPLSLGFTSDCEVVDMKITDDMTDSEIKDRLSAAMPEGIEIISVAAPVNKPKVIEKAVYEISLRNEDESAEDLLTKVKELFEKDSITVEKKSKKGVKEIELKQHLENALLSVSDGFVRIDITLPSSVNLSVNPSLIIKAIEAYTERETDETGINKKAMLLVDGSNFC